jgi:hypothetical protein
MSSSFPSGGVPAGLPARAKNILLTPDREWAVIDGEFATVASLYTGYIVILAAIGPVATFIHGVVFGYGAFGFTYHPSFFGALINAIVSYALSLGGAYVLALIIDALAPTFKGQKNFVQALKLVAYASTASYLAAIFQLVPGLGILGLLGLYSAYLFFKGLPVLMKSPQDQTVAYTAVIIVAAIVVAVIIGALTAGLTGHRGVRLGALDNTSYGSVTTPDGSKFQLDKFSQVEKALSDTAARAEAGTNAPRVATETLKTLLPVALPGGLQRGEVSSAGGQVAGFGASSAEATYGAGNHQVTLTVADLGAVGALASLGGVLGVSGESDTPTSYSHLTQQDGRTVAEEYDRQSHHGSYAIIVGSRFMVHAEGTPVSVDDLHAAVESVDVGRLEALAR